MKTVRIALLLALAGCAQLGQASYESELIFFEPSVFQSTGKLASSWNVISESERDIIQGYLVGLGVSSTGVIQLIAVYGDDASGAVLHFQQIDLYGTRLFWSVLVDSDDMSGRVIYHTQNERISDSFAPISDEQNGSNCRALVRASGALLSGRGRKTYDVHPYRRQPVHA